jgi:diguanylate cyclase (GGDEF)-like protein/PAS domain S-box-containing protein
MKEDNKTKKQLVHELTELRSQNAALGKTESAEKYRSLVESIRDVIYELDSQGVVLYISPGVRDLLGYDTTEIVGKSFIDLAHKDDLSNLTEWFSELRKGRELPSEYRIINKSGELRWARTKIRPIMEDGMFKGARGIIIDVTDQRRVEEALRESEKKYRLVVDNMADVIAIMDMNLRFTYVSPSVMRLRGYTVEEATAQTLEQVMTPESLQIIAKVFEEEMKSEASAMADPGRTRILELEEYRKDGSIVWIENHLSFMRDEAQKPVGIISLSHDITDRKRAEEALRMLAARNEAILSAVPDIIMEVDSYKRYTWVNQAGMWFFGEDVVGREASYYFEGEQETYNKVEPLFKGGEDIIYIESWQRRQDGEKRLLSWWCMALKNEQGLVIGALSTGRDITERKQAEAKLRQQTDAMDAAIDGMAILNAEGEYVYLNKAHAKIYGYENILELIGKSWRILYDSDVIQYFDQEIMPEFSRKGDWHGETIGTKKNGFKFPQELSLTAMANGGLICIVRDITDRKQTEEKLALNFEIQAAMNILLGLSLEGRPVKEFLYRALNLVLSLKWLVIESKGAIFLTDKAGETLHLQAQKSLSKELCAMCKTVPYGHCLCGRAAAARAVQFADHVDEHHDTRYEGMPPHGHYCVPILSGDHVLGVIVLYVKEGHIRSPWEEVFLKAVANSLAGTIERRQAEKELRESEERFRRIFDEGPFGMGLESPDHTIIAANKVLCELLGYTEQELTGKSVADITCEEDRERSKELLGQLFTNSIPLLRMEKRYIKKDGDILWANTTISAVHGQEGNVLYGLAIIEDLTESRKSADKIRLLAYYDSLTGLPNRTFHKELIKRSIEHAQRHKEIFALIYIGVDNFQRINDSLGYSIGDLLLKAVADRLTNSLRKSDNIARSDEGETVSVVSRVGGDEFIVLAHDLRQAQDAAKTSRRLLEEISAPYDLNGREVFITVSIGISLYPDDGTDVDDLLKNAEKAMRHTKSEGKNNYHFYSSSMHSSVLGLLTLENDLHKALERNELVLYYQPKVDAATRMIKGMEALIRWIHPDKGLIPPMQFIPMAETSGLIIPIGEFVIRTVCRQIKTWQDAGYKQMAISLNVSGIQFDQQNLIEIVKDALQDTMIPSQCLELEITESVLMRNPEKAIRILTELEAMGIGILIDDFGTGYSSLSYLKRLPALDFLKIDQSFIKGLASDPRDQAIVKATIAMAHSLNLKTIAEGVETQEQLSFLQEHGCDEIQGYFFSKPLPAEDIPVILAKGYL